MTQHPDIDDAIADEREDAVLTDALLDELGAERPDPEEFAAGVRSRIEQPRALPKPLPGYLRAAAALLPPFVLPKPLTAGISGAVATKGLTKLVPGVAAFPVAVVAILVVTMFVSVRALFRPVGAAAEDVSSKRIDRELSEWWRRHVLAVALVVVGLFVLLIFARVEAVVLIMVCSTIALLLIWGRLAAAGFATRDEVGKRASGILILVAANSFVFLQSIRSDQAAVLAVTPMLFLAASGCVWLTRGGGPRAVMIAGLGAVLVGAMSLLGVGEANKVAVTVDDVRRRIEATDDQPSWATPRDVARWVRHLRGAGEPLPDLSALRAAVHAFRDAELGKSRFDLEALGVIELGFARESDWRFWRTDKGYRERKLLEGNAPDSSLGYLATHLLAHTGELDEAGRAALARAIVAENGAELRYDAFDDFVHEIVLVEALGHGGLVAGMRERAQRLLRDRWIVTEDGRMLAFTEHRWSEEDAPGRRVERLSFVTLDSTSRAVELIARFGAPEEVDLVALGRYLDEQRLRYGFAELRSIHADAACALRRLQTLPAYDLAVTAEPDPPLLAVLMRWRVFAGALLLAGFALAATWRAPPAGPPATMPQ